MVTVSFQPISPPPPQQSALDWTTNKNITLGQTWVTSGFCEPDVRAQRRANSHQGSQPGAQTWHAEHLQLPSLLSSPWTLRTVRHGSAHWVCPGGNGFGKNKTKSQKLWYYAVHYTVSFLRKKECMFHDVPHGQHSPVHGTRKAQGIFRGSFHSG